MVLFYKFFNNKHFAVEVREDISEKDIKELDWFFGSGIRLSAKELDGFFVGSKPGTKEEWVENFRELIQQKKVEGFIDIAGFQKQNTEDITFNPIFNTLYKKLGQDIFEILYPKV